MNRKADSTKDKIIQSAFSFYDRVLFHKVSLSKIASRAGITKAAIYKHFKSRDDLERTLWDCFFADLVSAVRKILADNGKMNLETLIAVFCRNKEYVYYFMSMSVHFSMHAFFTFLSEKELKKEESERFKRLFFEDGGGGELPYADIAFTYGTIILFQSYRDHTLRAAGEADSDEYIRGYAKKMSAFMKQGIGHDLSETGMRRLSDLDLLCSREFSLPALNSILKSVSSIVERNGFFDVTVDAVASEIGIAKSSLYNEYHSWNEIIEDLMKEEVLRLLEVIKKNLLHSENSAESVYIIMETELEFFMRRKEILHIFKWYQIQNGHSFSKNDADFQDFGAFVCNSDLIEKLPDFGPFMDESAKMLISWIFHMPVFLLIISEERGFTEESIHAELKDIFFLMECGKSFLEYKKTENRR